ncbi:hypothetical protein MYX04_14655 [Nitrospiraceae bacterium AH_259_D15_M11_P09]|nr:hypothetical protein [Nitrospiraceae bacterium AH_259_D15_M11_P09]
MGQELIQQTGVHRAFGCQASASIHGLAASTESGRQRVQDHVAWARVKRAHCVQPP